MKCIRVLILATAAAVAASSASTAMAQQSEDATLPDAWAWRATLYGWFPSVHATTRFELPGGGNVAVDTNPNKYLTNLQFALMGTLEARKGPWSFIGDAVYVDFGKLKSGLTAINAPVGTLPLPASANVNVNLKGFVGELEGGYSLMHTSTANLDLVGGARYLAMKTRLNWEFDSAPPGVPPQGAIERRKDIWDGVVGLRGKTEIADDWYVPYYVDAGAGTSQYTWQAFAGLGYHFKWGDAMLGYRHLAYKLHGGGPVSDLAFGGPIAGIGFRF